MKKGLLLTLLILILATGNLSAQGHRIGVGLGSVSGEHEASGEKDKMKGELLELPVYSFVARSGMLIGFRLMEFSLSGEVKNASGLQRTEISFKQTLLAASIGYEFTIAQKILIAPQIVKSWFGNSRYHYSDYETYTSYPDTPYEYVKETDTVTGTADLSGWEIPIYYAGEYFLFGLKYSAYNNTTEIERPNGAVKEVSASGALSIVLDASF